MDSYYTPSNIAEQMVSAINVKNPKIVADFSVGGGELLKAAKTKWRRITCLATDVDSAVIRKIGISQPSWEKGKCDFLNPVSRNKCHALSAHMGKISVGLLNPPFSCRGGTKVGFQFRGLKVECSIGMAFVLISLDYLEAGGQLVAILPWGCLHSEKDSAVWRIIKSLAESEVISINNRNAFQNCYPKTAIIRLTKRVGNVALVNLLEVEKVVPLNLNLTAKIIRGNVPVYKWHGRNKNGGLPYIHSTELKNNSVETLKKRISGNFRTASSPVLLITRVGKPSLTKVALYTGSQRLVLSDCVIGIRFDRKANALKGLREIKANWKKIEAAYGGTCAPYITNASLLRVLKDIGISATILEDAKSRIEFQDKVFFKNQKR